MIGVTVTHDETNTPTGDDDEPAQSGASVASPTLPTAGIRYGVADGFDFGARVTNMSGLGIDGKIRTFEVLAHREAHEELGLLERPGQTLTSP